MFKKLVRCCRFSRVFSVLFRWNGIELYLYVCEILFVFIKLLLEDVLLLLRLIDVG